MPQRIPQVSTVFKVFAIAQCRNSGTSSSGTKTVFRPASPVLVKWSMNGLCVRSTPGLYKEHYNGVTEQTGQLSVFTIMILRTQKSCELAEMKEDHH